MNFEAEPYSSQPETEAGNCGKIEAYVDALNKVRALVDHANAIRDRQLALEGTAQEESFRREVREKRAAGLYNQDFIGMKVEDLGAQDLEMFQLVFGKQIKNDRDSRFQAYRKEVDRRFYEKSEEMAKRGIRYVSDDHAPTMMSAALTNMFMELESQKRRKEATN